MQKLTTLKKTNYNSIDLVKLICAILVVMIHIEPFGTHDSGSVFNLLNYGIQNYLARIAVPFFFVCSGFFLYKKTKLNEFDFEPTKKYAIKLLKFYIIWTLVYFPISFWGMLKNEKGFVYAFFSYIRDCIFTGSYAQLWYLPATIFSVLLISFLLAKKVKPKTILICAFVFYLIGLLAQSWFGLMLPLKEIAPTIWSMLLIVKKIISTTRDGLFFGFIFVSIGMLFAFYDFKITKRKSLVLFIISMVLMFFEAVFVKYYDFSRGTDMYLFAVPSTIFLFMFVKELKLPDNGIYKVFRSLSTLVFFSHFWVNTVVSNALGIVSDSLNKTPLLFILTLSITIILSLLVIYLSDKKNFKWLKVFYA